MQLRKDLKVQPHHMITTMQLRKGMKVQQQNREVDSYTILEDPTVCRWGGAIADCRHMHLGIEYDLLHVDREFEVLAVAADDHDHVFAVLAL